MLYDFLTGAALPRATDLRSYAWFYPYLEEFRKQLLDRPF